MVDLSLHLMDIIQNSVVVGSTFVEVGILAETKTNLLTLYVRDDGWGMSEETVRKVTDPFYTTRSTRKAGLGIPLFQSAAEMAGGMLSIESEINAGTTVTATFQIDHIDRKPLGDIGDTITMSILGHPELEYHLILKGDGKEFLFRTEEIRDVLAGVPLDDREILRYLKEMINEQIALIFGGILNEINS